MYIFFLVLAAFFGLPSVLAIADWFTWILFGRNLTGIDWGDSDARILSLIAFTIASIIFLFCGQWADS